MGIQDGAGEQRQTVEGLGSQSSAVQPPPRACDICGEPSIGAARASLGILMGMQVCRTCIDVAVKRDEAAQLEAALTKYPGLCDRHAMKGRAK